MLTEQFVGVEVYTIAFILAALSGNWLVGVAIPTLLLMFIFWMSDFVSLPSDMQFYYHVWLMSTIVMAAAAGHVFTKCMKCRPLIRFFYDDPLEEDIILPVGDVISFGWIASLLVTVSGVNLWLLRTVTGLSPINEDLMTAGIVLTWCGVAGILFCTFVLATRDVRARLTLKYLWLATIWPLPLLLTDYGFYHYVWGEPEPELLGALVFAVASVVIAVLAMYAPIRKPTETLEEGAKLTIGSYFDPFYKNKNYTILYFSGATLNIIIMWLAFTFIASWPDESLRISSIVILTTGGASILISMFASGMYDAQINSLRSKKGLKTTSTAFVDVSPSSKTESLYVLQNRHFDPIEDSD